LCEKWFARGGIPLRRAGRKIKISTSAARGRREAGKARGKCEKSAGEVRKNAKSARKKVRKSGSPRRPPKSRSARSAPRGMARGMVAWPRHHPREARLEARAPQASYLQQPPCLFWERFYASLGPFSALKCDLAPPKSEILQRGALSLGSAPGDSAKSSQRARPRRQLDKHRPLTLPRGIAPRRPLDNQRPLTLARQAAPRRPLDNQRPLTPARRNAPDRPANISALSPRRAGTPPIAPRTSAPSHSGAPERPRSPREHQRPLTP
jgi:hypothetical protein